MAFGYDGSVRIKADLNHSNFDQGLSAMTGKVQSFGNTLKKLAGIIGLAFGTAAIINFAKEAVNAASALNDAWIGLQSIVEGQGKSFSKAKSFINDYISDGLVPLENAVTSYKNLAARGYTTEQIETVMTALKDAAAFGRQSSYSLGEAVATATEGLKNENSILVDNAGVTKNVAKMWQEYANEIGVSYTALTQEQKIQAEVNGILEETRFQTGDAAKLVNTYSGQVALLGYNFQNLKVQVGNAIMPVVQAVLPGINAIISALTKLATVFAQVTALLFGKSAQVTATDGIASSAGAAADATDDLAAATEGAGDASEGAAKQMKSILAGFDELNILADDTASSLGGAAGGLGAGVPELEIPSYESEIDEANQLEEAFSSLGELFVKTLDDMLAAMPAFKQALLDFATDFNDFNQKLYDGFKFDGVLDRVIQLGAELADAFNGLVSAIDWELWGRTLGAGLNTGLNFITSFIYEFDWVNLGDKLAEFINGLVYEIDWYEFGRLLWAKFKIALETFAGFILGLDMPELAKAASDIIIGFFDSMQETIANIDWAGVGSQIAEFLNNIDWVGIIDAISGALGEMIPAALDLIGGFIENADTDTLLVAAAFLGSKLLEKLVDKVISPIAKEISTNLIKEIAAAITGEGAGGLLSSIAPIVAVVGGAFLGISNFLEMLENGFNWVNEALMLLGIAIAAVGAAILFTIPTAVAAAVAGIVAAVATLVVLVKEHWEEIKAGFIAVWEAIQEAWNAAGEWFDTNVIQPITKFFTELWDRVKKAASEAWDNVEKAWNAAGEWFNTNVVQPIVEFFTGLWENAVQLASDAWDNIVSVWEAVSGWFDENIVQPLTEFFTNLWENAKQLASNAWNGISDVWKVVSGWFDVNVIQPVGQFFSGLWEGIRQTASDLWNNIVGIWEEAPTWFKEHVTGPLGNAFSAAAEFIKGVINGIIGTVEGMVNSVIKAINWVISQINKLSIKIPDNPITGPLTIGFNIQPLSGVQLPRLANGAVIPPNQQFAAILGDQRSGTNIEAPLKTIEQALRNVLSETGMGGDINITVESVLDGKVVARNTVKHINSMTRSAGRSPLYT
ncbi:MAG: hypothetical protein [Caudoviricetes sp.]|nr:MAG: hypothetical protein [Caudoviricetes sp.]